MCVVKQPKIQTIQAPSAPPPPAETAGGVQASPASKSSNDRSAKRRGLQALLVRRPDAGLNSPPSGAGLNV